VPAAGRRSARSGRSPRHGRAGPRLLPPTDFVAHARRVGLLVHPFTFRNEQKRLASDFEGNSINEYLAFYELGIDGVFSNVPDTAFDARRMFLLKTDRTSGSH